MHAAGQARKRSPTSYKIETQNSSSRQHPSCDDCLEDNERIIRTVMCCFMNHNCQSATWTRVATLLLLALFFLFYYPLCFMYLCWCPLYRVGHKTPRIFKRLRLVYMIMQKGDPHIKLFSTLSGVRMLSSVLPQLNILCISIVKRFTRYSPFIRYEYFIDTSFNVLDFIDAECRSITWWAVVLNYYINHSAKHRIMADFDPSGSQNPSTDFYDTRHGWLSPGPCPIWQLCLG